MGVQTDSVVEVVRNGRKRLVIDFGYVDANGEPQRYRRAASVQTLSAARAEAVRLKLQAQQLRTLKRRAASPSFAACMDGAASAPPSATPRRLSPRERYAALLTQCTVAAFGRQRMSYI